MPFFYTILLFLAPLLAHAQPRPPDEGPYSHEVWSASSPDGLQWSEDSRRVLQHASVPAAIVNQDGSLRLYYVDGEQKPSSIGTAFSLDGGRTFERMSLQITGLPQNIVPVDPAPVLLTDGRIRLYFFGSHFGLPPDGEVSQFGGQRPQGPDRRPQGMRPDGMGPRLEDHSIYAAVSTDGIAFMFEGPVFSHQGLVDPDVFHTGQEWLMYVHSMGLGTIIARSKDGLSFVYEGPMRPPGWGTTAAVKPADGRFRLYAFKQPDQQTIASFVSVDGVRWTQEPGTRLKAPPGKEITDPYVVQLKDGGWKMFYKLSKAKGSRPY